MVTKLFLNKQWNYLCYQIANNREIGIERELKRTDFAMK
jgi:hypothetical protein